MKNIKEKTMKILITGSSGTLANSVFTTKNLNRYKLFGVDKKESNNTQYLVDISNFVQLRKIFTEIHPKIIFHFASETNVDLCETDKLNAILNNFVTTKNLVDIIKTLNIPIVFTSTASIFDGKKNFPYKEEDKPSPCNFYALTKHLSEEYIKTNLSKYFIFRFGWLVGNPKIDQKFFGKIKLKLNDNGSKLFGVNDQFGSLTFADEFSDLLFKIINTNYFGTYHFASEGNTSRYQIISEILKYKSLSKSVSLENKELKYFNLTAQRPQNEILDIQKVKDLGIHKIKNWKVDLKNYLEKYDF